MDKKRFFLIAGISFGILVILMLFVIPTAFLTFAQWREPARFQTTASTPESAGTDQRIIPTLPAATEADPSETTTSVLPDTGGIAPLSVDLSELYPQINPGIVNVQVFVANADRPSGGVGSGFILDEAGHIVTNNHVIAGAEQVTVVFFNGLEAQAEVIGADDDSDLAVLKVEQLPDETHPLPLGDSDQVQVGEWVVAIGNPFGLGSSMSVGIVSAIGRTIESGATPFQIPQAIQTDAAINPGNSGGPLLSLEGDVIGVNAQIATQGGIAANSGVGFAIPSNVVRGVAPVLIERGNYQWPWLGVSGVSVNLLIMRANNLETQAGAYLAGIVEGGPAANAGLQGSTGTVKTNGLDTPVGGDVVIEIDEKAVLSFSDLLVEISNRDPGDTVRLTILRGGQRQEVTVTLQARPENFSAEQESLFPDGP